jgi:hypothetical protein
MSKRNPKPSPLGDVLEQYFSRCGMKRRLAEQRVLNSWEKIVGKGVAEQTRPLRIQNGVLQVRVANSVWMQQLQFMKGLILQKARGETGLEGLEEVRFFLGDLAGEADPEEGAGGRGEGEPEADRPLTENEREKIRAATERLADPEMRKVFESVFSRGLTGGRNSRPGRKREGK